MNTKSLFIFICFMLCLTGCNNIFSGNREAPTGNLVSCLISEYGTAMYPMYYYKVEKNQEGEILLYNISFDGDTTVHYVDNSVIDDIEKIIIDNQMYDYKESYKPHMKILDGYLWSFEAKYDDKTKLYSHGNNTYPRNSKGLHVLKDLLSNVYKEVADTTGMPKGTITSFNYIENGTAAEPYVFYEMITAKNRISLKYINGDGEYKTIKLTSDITEQIRNTIKDYKIYKYKSHYIPDMEVLDGYSWNLEIKFSSGEVIHSSGSNARPNNKGLKKILNILDEKTQKNK